jgi:catechol 2,3-dioxygenase-like lactoylglutathione lyase family enzyme
VPDEERPRLQGVLETVLYFRNEEQTERFYTEILGMTPIGKEPGRHLFFRAGGSVFLLFNADSTRTGSAGMLPHGAEGEGHACFVVSEDEYEAWKEHFQKNEVEVLKEIDWGRGMSFYFRDPDGNLLEIANRDFWP